MNIAFPPPQRWQDFEELTVQVFRSVFDDISAQGHGRSGQKQLGVDIFGRERASNRLIGIQCKSKTNNFKEPSTTLLNQDIDKEITLAEDFKPPLDYFIIATTGFRDTTPQRHIAYRNQGYASSGHFPVGLWFWEDYVGYLNNDSKLSQWYSRLTHEIYGEKLNDIQILSVIRTAFNRAAFRTPLHLEIGGEFRQALLDTERVLNTGVLLDRETRMPICRAPAGLSEIKYDPNGRVRQILNAVKQIRVCFDEGVHKGTIRTSGFCLILKEPSDRSKIDQARSASINQVNSLLREHGLEEIPASIDRADHW